MSSEASSERQNRLPPAQQVSDAYVGVSVPSKTPSLRTYLNIRQPTRRNPKTGIDWSREVDISKSADCFPRRPVGRPREREVVE
jgi:hypothetical protein